MIHRAHRIELDPTCKQAGFLARACGVARYTYNWALAEAEKTYQETGKGVKLSELKKRWNQEKPDWVYESPKDANQQPFTDLRAAYGRFFKKLGEKPRFKKRGKSRDSFYVSNDKFTLERSNIRLPLIGTVRLKEPPRFNGSIMSARVTRSANRWFVSIDYELEITAATTKPLDIIGVDLGIKTLAVLSDGTSIANPKHLRRAQMRLKRLQRQLARKVKGSANRVKAAHKLAVCHYRVACKRNDTLHKATTMIARKASLVVIEDLNVSGMVKNHNLAAAVQDCGFFEFRRQLEYKAERVLIAPQFYPSSKLCHSCGAKNEELKLSDRSWTCVCGIEHDRDLNAALNLESLGRVTPEFTPVETVMELSLKQEPNREPQCSHLG